jgi:hypothetical protein
LSVDLAILSEYLNITLAENNTFVQFDCSLRLYSFEVVLVSSVG